MIKPYRLLQLAAAILLFAALNDAALSRAAEPAAITAGRSPRLKPDYTGLTIPPNIAPLNFTVLENGSAFKVCFHAKSGSPIEIGSATDQIVIPAKPWRELIDASKGSELLMDICVKNKEGQWVQFTTVTNTVASDEIDPILIYRKIHPSHNRWTTMGLFQRDLRNFKETPFVENKRFSGGCCHCHALRNNDPDYFLALVRSEQHKNSLLIISNGVVSSIGGQVGAVSWHPKAPLVAASFAKTRLMLHTARNDMRDITELEDWVGYFSLDSKTVKHIPGLDDKRRLVTFPAWSPDGLYLYYCSAPNPLTNGVVVGKSYEQERYDLMRISYNLERDQWGQPEPVILARDIGFSMAQPRISPDGNWLYVCCVPYGCWPAYDRTSDIYGINLKEGAASGKFSAQKLSLNSTECESWLSWSSNSRWVVFSSKRGNPLFNRTHIAYIAADGRCGKPFVVPQEDPEFYDSMLRTYTIPTLATHPVRASQCDLITAIKNPAKSTLSIPAAEHDEKLDSMSTAQ